MCDYYYYFLVGHYSIVYLARFSIVTMNFAILLFFGAHLSIVTMIVYVYPLYVFLI